MKILVQFPTRGRPDRFASTLYMYQHLRTTDNVTFMITIDRDDDRMNNPRILSQLMMWKNLSINLIEPCGKIGAINAGVRAISQDYDIIVLASDDMVPAVKGWDKRIIDDMTQLYPDTDGVLWYNDGYVGKKLNTLCILGTKYYRRFNYIYHPEYKAFWCDNEFMDVGNHLNKQTYINDIIIRHEHPINGHGKNDKLNIRDNQFYYIDKATYERRKSEGFGLALDSYSYPTGSVTDAGAVASADQQPAVKPKRKRKGTGVHLVGQSGADDRGQA